MSVDGLVSGMDTTSLISQLIQAESAPKAALETRLKTTGLAASAYRTLNTTFAAVRAAADNMLKPEAWTPVRSTSSSPTVSISATAGALPSALTFTVDRLATSHSVVHRNTGTWSSAASPYGATEIQVRDENGASLTPTISVGGTGTLADAAAAINAATDFKLSASVVQLSSGEAALRVTSKETGAASRFSFGAAQGTLTDSTVGVDAQISIGADNPVTVTSASNTFESILPGTTFTISDKPAAPVTVTVAEDRDGVASKVQSLVDAVNAATKSVRDLTNNAKGSTQVLKGDFSVSQLAGQLLDAVTHAIGADAGTGRHGVSPATIGLELSKDGKLIEFDKAAFLTALTDDPDLARRMTSGAPAGTDSNGDPVPAVIGFAERLRDVSKAASDTTTGSLVKLATNQESMGKDITARIEAWDLRLAKRKEMLTRQFGAMETALSSLRNQSTWLAGQINSLPSYS
jgi:flagellar hook-associated protein 2